MSPLKFSITNFFPKNEYPPADKEDIPLFLIAHRNDKALIIKQYEKSKRNPRHVGPYGLTALTVAVMAKYHEIVSYLVWDLKVARDPKDHAGFTPMVYACALRDAKSVGLLQKADKVQHTLNVYEFFPGWKTFLEPQFPNPDDIVIHRKLDTDELVPVTGKQFQEITGARFCNSVISSKTQFLKLLEKRLKEAKSKSPMNLLTYLKQYAKETFEKSSGSPPELYLSSQGAAGMGVFAGEDLKLGSFIAVYGSEIDITSKDDSPFRFNEFTGERIRNAGTMINDGPPNATFLPVEMPDGRYFPVLIALEGIKKDAPITINYSISHPVKSKMPHVEVSLKEVEEYFKANPPQKILDDLKGMNAKLPKIHDSRRVIAFFKKIKMFQYLFHTPSTLYILLLKGILKKEQLSPLEGDGEFYSWIEANSPEFPQLAPITQQFFKGLEPLSELFEDSSQEAIKLKKMLLNFFETHSFLSISLFLRHLLHPFVFPSKCWKKELDIYPTLMENIEYVHSLCFSSELSPDRKKLLNAGKNLSNFPMFKPYACASFIDVSKKHAPRLLPLFQEVFGKSASQMDMPSPELLSSFASMLSDF